jgi:type IV secretory pathway ATPase VirB11/archaellum biosynthesis ATPase
MIINPQSLAGLAAYLSICTGDFAGRAWVFEAIDCWLAEENSRFFLIIGQPGSGKTTLCAR